MIIKENYQDALTLPETVECIRKRRLDRTEVCNPALLILDMQNFFISDTSHAWVPDAVRIVDHISRLKDEFLKRDQPVIFTRHINTDGDALNMGKWWRDILRREDSLSELYSEFDTENCKVVEKAQYDAFTDTDLEEYLKNREVNSLVITGVMTHLCCETTARAAFVKGFEVLFGIDVTASYNRDFHNASLLNIGHGFGLPVYSDELIKMLEKGGLK